MAHDEADDPQAVTPRARLEGRVARPLLAGSFRLPLGRKGASKSIWSPQRG